MTLNFIPKQLRPWIADICHRHSAPVEAVAAPMLVMLGAAVGARASIQNPCRRYAVD